MPKQSLLKALGLPDEFGVTLLLLALVLLLAPYLSGKSLGFIDIPKFGAPTNRVLRIFGPVAMLAALLLHFPWLEQPPPPGAGGATTCTLAGRVFDRDSNQPLSGIWVDLYRDLSSIQQRPTPLKARVATTGPDGEFAFNCTWVQESQFPLLLAVRHPDWVATRITGPKIERPGQWEGINIAIPMSEIEWKPLREIVVSFSTRKIGADWFLVGDIENKSSRSFRCIRARFQMRTSYQDKLQGEPDRDLGVVDVEVRDLGPHEKRPYQRKLPKQVGISLTSKQECQ